jgi:alcohol dehydrogenase
MVWWDRADNWRFWLGSEIRFAVGLWKELARLVGTAGKRIFLVGYAPPSPLDPLYDALAGELKKEGWEFHAFLKVTGEPSVKLAVEGYESANRVAPEIIVGVGGGSVLDTAKAIAYQVRTGIPMDRCVAASSATARPEGLSRGWSEQGPKLRGMSCKLILMPTTPGSGSEVTEVALLGGEVSAGETLSPIPVKFAVSSSWMRADVAIVDPELVKTCPYDILYRSAVDALAHAVESGYSRASNPLSFMCAAQAFRILYEIMPRLGKDPMDPALGKGIALAGLLGGMALNTAGVGVAHALAHGLGAVLGLPHAEAVAMALPQAVKFNRKQAESQLASLARLAGICNLSEEGKAVSKFEEWIMAVTGELIRSVKARYQLSLADENTCTTIARSAEASSILPLRLNPRRVRFEDLVQLSSDLLREGETSLP